MSIEDAAAAVASLNQTIRQLVEAVRELNQTLEEGGLPLPPSDKFQGTNYPGFDKKG